MMRRPGRDEEDKPKVPGWIVSFTDMITLLLSFFVLLQSLAEVRDPELFFEGQGSFVRAIRTFGLPGFMTGEKAQPNRDFTKPRHPTDTSDQERPVNRLIDARDKQRSAVKRFRSGRIMRILRYEFLVDRLQGATLFKLPEKVLQNLYVTEPFVERVVEHALRGFEFRLIWTDAPYVLRCPYCMGVIAEDTELCPTCGLDTTRDAVLETSLHEMKEMKHVSCPFCKTRIPALADPCPYCKRGKRRRGTREGPVII